MPRKILVVDDDPDMVDVLSMLLKVNGYEPLKAHSGKEGLDLAREKMPDVILLDIMMPGMDGWEVLQEIRLDEKTTNIPVIFVTARMDEESRKKAASMGAQGYITKPYRRGTLMAKIREFAGGVDVRVAS